MANKKIAIDIVDADIDFLHSQIKTQVGEAFHGVYKDKEGYSLIVAEDITQSDLVKARHIAQMHDPADKPVKDIEAEKARAKAGKFDEQINKINDANVYDILLRLQAEIDELKGKK